MKKLLALILCVMMFVSVIPTMAFAEDAPTSKGVKEYPWIDNPLESATQYQKEINNMIKNTKSKIETAYGVLIGDQVVYNSAKGMDDTIVGLVDAIANPLLDKGKMTKDDVTKVKDSIRLLMDELVATDMAKTEKYTDSDGKVDPIKYAQTFAKAVNDAMTGKKFQKGYEAVATYFALSQMVSDINDKLSDDYTAFVEGIDGKFDKNFTALYPMLGETYVDTITEAAAQIKDKSEEEAAEILAKLDPWANYVEAVVGDPS